MKKHITVFLLFPLASAFALALDMYIPIVPRMVEIFGTTQQMVQWTLNIFIIGTGIGQLFFGPLSDQIGRRAVVIGSTLLFILASILCSFAHSISFLIAYRFLQSLGSCGMYVSALSIVRDLFDERQCARIMSYLSGVIGISPFIGPIVGGYLMYVFNWKASFYFLGLFGVLTLLCLILFFVETHVESKRIPVSSQLFARYATIIRNKEFLAFTIASAAGTSSFFSFFSASPYILEDLLGVPFHQYGYYFGSIGLLFFVCSFIAGHLAEKYGVSIVTKIGSILLIGCGGSMALWYYVFGLSIAGLMVPMILFGLGGSCLIGPGSGGAIGPFPHMAGSASSLYGALSFLLTFVVGALVMVVEITSTLSLAYGILGSGIVSLTIGSILRLPRRD